MEMQTQRVVTYSKVYLSTTPRRRSGFASFTSKSNHVHKCSLSLSTNSQLTQHDNTKSRPLANFSPSIWGDRFSSSTYDDSKIKSYEKEAEELKDEVRKMISVTCTNDPIKIIELIDTLNRLGVSYHFENEIEEQLSSIFKTIDNIINEVDYDLYTVGLMFQVFRRYGYKLSCDVFNKFKGKNGKFEETLCQDVKGMLSLNEATHLRVNGEDILEEAIDFTTNQLNCFVTQTNSHQLSNRIRYSLKQPFHKGIERVEVRKFISFYEEDGFKDERLLKFAKLDFNCVQLLHQQELALLTGWWKDLNMVSKLPYIRDRVVEMYFQVIGIYFEPHYSLFRLIVTKMTMLLSVIDDTYDAYGLIEELQQFTDAIERWDIAALDQLPEYMKIIYIEVLKLYDQCEIDVAEEGKSYGISYAKDEVKKIVRGYQIGARWSSEGYVPTFEEYMKHYGQITCGIYFMTASGFVGMDNKVGMKEFEWLLDINKPKIITVAEYVGRYMDDIATHEAEEKRNVLSGVPCYMKEYRVSKEETFKKFYEGMIDGWKDMNEEYMSITSVSKKIIKMVINLIRFGEVVYYGGMDGYTDSEYLKDIIAELFINPITV